MTEEARDIAKTIFWLVVGSLASGTLLALALRGGR